MIYCLFFFLFFFSSDVSEHTINLHLAEFQIGPARVVGVWAYCGDGPLVDKGDIPTIVGTVCQAQDVRRSEVRLSLKEYHMHNDVRGSEVGLSLKEYHMHNDVRGSEV